MNQIEAKIQGRTARRPKPLRWHQREAGYKD